MTSERISYPMLAHELAGHGVWECRHPGAIIINLQDDEHHWYCTALRMDGSAITTRTVRSLAGAIGASAVIVGHGLRGLLADPASAIEDDAVKLVARSDIEELKVMPEATGPALRAGIRCGALTTSWLHSTGALRALYDALNDMPPQRPLLFGAAALAAATAAAEQFAMLADQEQLFAADGSGGLDQLAEYPAAMPAPDLTLAAPIDRSAA